MQNCVRLKKHYFRTVITWLYGSGIIKAGEYIRSLGIIEAYIHSSRLPIFYDNPENKYYLQLNIEQYKSMVRYIKLNRIEAEFGELNSTNLEFLVEFESKEKDIELL